MLAGKMVKTEVGARVKIGQESEQKQLQALWEDCHSSSDENKQTRMPFDF